MSICGCHCHATLSARIQSASAVKPIEWRCTVQMDNEPKHIMEAAQRRLKAKKWDIQ